MLEIKPENYYLGMWYMELPGGNWLCSAYHEKDQPEDNWTLLMRFRWYKDDKIFDSDDRRNWYTMKAVGESAEQVTAHMTVIAEQMLKMADAQDFQTQLSHYEINGNGDAFAKMVIERPPPFMHAQQMSKEEAEEKYGKEITAGSIDGSGSVPASRI